MSELYSDPQKNDCTASRTPAHNVGSASVHHNTHSETSEHSKPDNFNDPQNLFGDYSMKIVENDPSIPADPTTVEDNNGRAERFFTAADVFQFPSYPNDIPPEIGNLDPNDTDAQKIAQLLHTSELPTKSYNAWLGKDVLLQGKIYISKDYLLFYSHLPPATLEVLKATPLDKKGASLIPGKASYSRFWFVLRMGSLSWYEEAGDKYFPIGLLPLHLMESVTRLKNAPEKFIIKALNGKSYAFRCDSRNGAHEWCKVIRKEMFRSKVHSEDFTAVVRIPLQNIISASVQSVISLAELLFVPVITHPSDPQNPGRPVMGNYTFAFFDTSTANEIYQVLRSYTNNFKNMGGVQLTHRDKSLQPTLNYEASVFGNIRSDMLDTTPPSSFKITEDSHNDNDKDVVFHPGLINMESRANSGQASRPHSMDVSREASRPESRAQSQTPSRDVSPSVSPSDLNHSTTSKKKHPLKHFLSKFPHRSSSQVNVNSARNSPEPGLLDTSNEELSKLIGFTTIPYKMIMPNNIGDDEDSDDENVDADYGSEDVGNAVDPKFNEDNFFPYAQKNFNRKVSFASQDMEAELQRRRTSHSLPGRTGSDGTDLKIVPTKEVEDEQERAKFNAWFQDFFGLEPFVALTSEYLCSLEKPIDGSIWDGKLLLSNLYLCFHRVLSGGIASTIVGGKNQEEPGDNSQSRMVIPLNEITHLKRSEPDSTELCFEVAAAVYGVFKLNFHDVNVRADAENALQLAIDNVPIDKGGKVLVKGRGPDFNFMDYDLRTARLTTYEPEIIQKLRCMIPTLFLDPTTANTRYDILHGRPRKQLKFVMMMIGSRGDVQPYIALCQGLMKEGHKCCIVTHGEFKSFVEKYGIEHREIAGDPRELMEIMIEHGSISYSFIKDAMHHFKHWIRDLMKTSWIQVKDSNADVFIESPSSMIGIHIAEALGIPYFRAFTMPWTRNKMYPQAMVAPEQNHSGSYNALTYSMYERAVWFFIAHEVNKWRRKHLHLPSTDLYTQRLEEIPFLYCVSPTVMVPPVDQPEWVHTCGYWNLQRDTKEEEGQQKGGEQKQEEGKANDNYNDGIDPKLKDFIENAHKENKAVVYIGFGSIIVQDPEAMTKSVVDATKDADVYCVLARGWSARSTKKEHKNNNEKKKHEGDKDKIKAQNIFEVESVDHSWLFPRIEVCVHHGGSGTTGASLSAGKPTIIKPFFGDQFFWASRVEALGVGKNLKQLTTEGLRDALKACCSDSEMIRQASVLGDQIMLERGVEEAVLSLYKESQYARDVTIRRRKRTEDYSKLSLLPNPTNIISSPHHLFGFHNYDLSALKKTLLHPWGAKSNADREKDKMSTFSFPEFSRREEQQRRMSKTGEIDVSL